MGRRKSAAMSRQRSRKESVGANLGQAKTVVSMPRQSAPESQVRQGVTFGATVGRSRVLAGRHLGYLCVRRERRLA
jgi:hypothetical protein